MTVPARKIIIFSWLILFSCQKADKSAPLLSPIQKVIQIPQSLNKPLDSTQLPIISFTSRTIEFDTIEEGITLERVITFTNTGKVPLVIGDVQSSCGCTAIRYTTDYILPDSSGQLMIRFNSQGWPREQNKSIFVLANTFPNQTVLSLHGYVKPKYLE